MTCIAGVMQNGKVWIGGDSAGSNGYQTRTVAHPKVFKSGEFVVGYTTSFRMGQLLEYWIAIRPQMHDEDDYAYMIKVVAEGVRDTFKDHGFAVVENSQESGGTFLIGYRGGLYLVQSDFSVIQHRDGFDAIGCGESYALAALKAFEGLPPKKRIKRALEIASYFADGVSGPFTIKTT